MALATHIIIYKYTTGNVIYITTGSRVPPGANAVVKVEDTCRSDTEPNVVIIRVDVPADENIRFIGSDIM